LLEAIDDRLRNGRSICRHVRGKIGIRHVEEQEIYEVDGGGYGWCVNFVGNLVTARSLRDDKQIWRARRRGRGLRGETTRPEENREGQYCGWNCYGSSLHEVFLSRRDRISDRGCLGQATTRKRRYESPSQASKRRDQLHSAQRAAIESVGQTKRNMRDNSDDELESAKLDVACSLAARTHNFLNSIFGKPKLIGKTDFK
jgi:hypothetical protein